MKKQKELDRLTKELVKQMTGNEVEDPQEGDYQIAYYYLSKAMDYTHSCTELKTFDIHECINEVTKSANKLSPWIVDARKDRSFRYRVKKAIDKMLYSN